MVKSQAEQQALSNKISNTVWMGLHRDPKDTSRWLWVDGTRATYTNWGTGEPNNEGGNEGCGVIWPASHNWKWNDGVCSSSLPYICETKGKRIEFQICLF